MSGESDEEKVRRYTENLKSGTDPKRALKRLYDLQVPSKIFQRLETRKYVKRYLDHEQIGKYAARLRQKLKNQEKEMLAERRRRQSSESVGADDSKKPEQSIQLKEEPMSSHELFSKAIAEQQEARPDSEVNKEKVKPDYSKFKVSKKRVEVKKEPKSEPFDDEYNYGASSSSSYNLEHVEDIKPQIGASAKNYIPSTHVLPPPPSSSSSSSTSKGSMPSSSKRQGANLGGASSSEKNSKPSSSTYDEKMFKPRKERLKVFAGRKKKTNEEIDKLVVLCQNTLAANVNMIGYVAWTPFNLLRPALIRCNIDQLRRILDINPPLAEDADCLFHEMIEREFPNYANREKEKNADWTWREVYDRLVTRKEKKEKDKLEMLTNRIGKGTSGTERRTMVIDSAHTNVRRRTACTIPTKLSSSHMTTTPSAVELSKARKNVQTEGKTQLNSLQAPIRRAIQLSKPPEKRATTTTAPLMAKVRKMMKR